MRRDHRYGLMLGVVTLLVSAVWWLPGRSGTHRAQGPAPRAMQPVLRAPLSLPRLVTGALSGKISDDRGAAVAGARVCATCVSCDPTIARAQRCTDSDAQGHYGLSELEPLGYRITATADGFAPARANRGAPVFVRSGEAERGVDVRLGARGVELTGTVVDALGGPIVRALVRGAQLDGTATTVEVHSDQDGRFSVWAAPGNITLVASATGYAPIRQFRVAPSRDVELVLTPASSLQGVVVSRADGTPIADAEVRAHRVGDAPLPSDSPVLSGEDGTFSIGDLDQGEYVVEAAGQNYRGRSTRTVSLGLGELATGVVVHADAAVTVSGQVLVGDNRTACDEGAVTLGPPGPSPFATAAAAPEIQRAIAAGQQRGQAAPAALAAPIGPDGSVRFNGVPPGQYMVTVRCADHVLRRGPELLTVGAEPIANLEWQVERGATLTVLVVDEDRRPLPRAQAALFFPPFEAGHPGPMMTLTMDCEGRYGMPSVLRPGTYRIEPFGGAQGEPAVVTLRDGARATEATLVLRGNATLLVDVLTSAGNPVDNVEVIAHAAGRAPASERATPPQPWNAIALGAGQYRIAPLPVGSYRVEVDDGTNPAIRARQGGSDDIVVSARGVTRARAVLPPAAEIRGTVRDERGQPLANVWVSAQSEGVDADAGGRAALRYMLGTPRRLSDPEGAFTLERLHAEASYSVRAEQPGNGAQVVRGIRAGREVELVLRSPAVVRGQVTDEHGAPIPEFTVQAVQLDIGERHSAQVSARDGRFVLEGVTPGSVELTASDAQQRVGLLRIEVAPAQIYEGAGLTLRRVALAEMPSTESP